MTFVVESGQGAAEIADNLVKAKIVKSAAAFTSAVSGAGRHVVSGIIRIEDAYEGVRCGQGAF